MLHIIINPAAKSGRGGKLWERLAQVLKEEGVAYDLHFTMRVGDAGRFARELTGAAGGARLLVCGGDGTLNEILQGICDLENTEIYYIPQGSANDFARDFKEKGTPAERLRRMLKSQPYLLDIGLARVETPDGTQIVKRFAGSSGIGFDAQVCVGVERSKLKKFLNRLGLGKLTYLAVALRRLIFLKSAPISIRVDGGEKMLVKKCLFTAVMVHRYEGGGFMFCPDADPSDGLLDLCIAANITRRGFVKIMPSALRGRHAKYRREVTLLRAGRVRIRTDRPLYFHVDGEAVCQAARVELTCLKQKLRLRI